MNEIEMNSAQKNQNILKLSLSYDESNSDNDKKEEDKSDNENNKKNNSNKNKKLLNIKKFKEDNNSEFNNANLYANSNKGETNHENNNSSDYTNEKEITLGKLYSYRRPYSKYRRKLIFILICIINILINCDHGAIPAGTKS